MAQYEKNSPSENAQLFQFIDGMGASNEAAKLPPNWHTMSDTEINSIVDEHIKNLSAAIGSKELANTVASICTYSLVQRFNSVYWRKNTQLKLVNLLERAREKKAKEIMISTFACFSNLTQTKGVTIEPPFFEHTKLVPLMIRIITEYKNDLKVLSFFMTMLGFLIDQHNLPASDESLLVKHSSLWIESLVTLLQSKNTEAIEASLVAIKVLHGFLALTTPHIPQSQWEWERKLVQGNAIEILAQYAKTAKDVRLYDALHDIAQFCWVYGPRVIKTDIHKVAVQLLKKSPVKCPPPMISSACQLISVLMLNGDANVRSALLNAGTLEVALKFIDFPDSKVQSELSRFLGMSMETNPKILNDALALKPNLLEVYKSLVEAKLPPNSIRKNMPLTDEDISALRHLALAFAPFLKDPKQIKRVIALGIPRIFTKAIAKQAVPNRVVSNALVLIGTCLQACPESFSDICGTDHDFLNEVTKMAKGNDPLTRDNAKGVLVMCATLLKIHPNPVKAPMATTSFAVSDPTGMRVLSTSATPVAKAPTHCALCGKEGRKKCGNCKRVYYCSRECQVKDWSAHKTQCKSE